MPNNTEKIVEQLLTNGVSKIIGVLGSGDSLRIVENFLTRGGDFIETSSEFAAPVIASAINKFGSHGDFAASISIRGPGLASSLPGLYHNFLEDLKSLSISESLRNKSLIHNFHKNFDTKTALKTSGFVYKKDKLATKYFDLTLEGNPNTRMLHLATNDTGSYTYSRSINEMCSNKLTNNIPKSTRKLFVIGKRGIEKSVIQELLLNNAPFFLTPAALPYADLNLPNYLGVWTGNEQFLFMNSDNKLFTKSTIFRLGVMKRELLNTQSSIPTFDFPLLSRNESLIINELANDNKFNDCTEMCQRIKVLREKIAHASHNWSVFSVVSVINNLNFDFNYSLDVGSFATVIENFIRLSQKNRIHSSFIGKFMGTAIPIAIGLGITRPKIPVLCMVGEGGFAYSYNEIASIVNLNLPILILVFSNKNMYSVAKREKISESLNLKLLPVGYEILEKTKIANLITSYVECEDKLISEIHEWDKKSPKLIFLKFKNEFYAKGVELLR